MKMSQHARQLMLAAGERQFRHSQRHGTRPMWRLFAGFVGIWLVTRAVLPVDQRSAVEVAAYLRPVGWTVLLAAPLMALVLAGPLDWWDRTVSHESWSFAWRAIRFILVVVPVFLLAGAPIVGYFLAQVTSLPVVRNTAPWGDVRLVLATVVWLIVYDFAHSMLALAYTSQDPSLKTQLDWSVRWAILLVQVTFAVVGMLFGFLRRLGRGLHDLQRHNKIEPTDVLEDLLSSQPREDHDVLEGELVDDVDDHQVGDDVEELLVAVRGKVYADAT